ncbi:unnamed protein product, partial [Didymodactylos carnosus]
TTILSDNGSHFQNQLMTALTQSLGHNHIYSTTYHPQTNGCVERFNATFVPQLAKLQDEEANNWDEFLPSVVFAYNTGQHFSTKYSPFQLQYGCAPRLPPDQAPPTVIFNRPCDYFYQLQKNLEIYHKIARENIIRNQQLSKQRYDRNRRDPHYKVGDLVLTRYYGIRNKLGEKYSKFPARIIEVQHPVYWVQQVETKAIARVHINDLHRVPFGSTDSLSRIALSVPAFTLHPDVYYLNTEISLRFLQDLIDKCKTIKHYVIDTESDIDTQHPCLIQVLPIPETYASSPLFPIIIDTNFLPAEGTRFRVKIEELCGIIFHRDNHFYAWGDCKEELSKFRGSTLFSLSNIINTTNVQITFRKSYNKHHPHLPDCPALQLFENHTAEDDYLLTATPCEDPEDGSLADHPSLWFIMLPQDLPKDNTKKLHQSSMADIGPTIEISLSSHAPRSSILSNERTVTIDPVIYIPDTEPITPPGEQCESQGTVVTSSATRAVVVPTPVRDR